ncbi:hypothetical protein MMSR116_22640 [Methylobacterium mesophilicum SR1.6/6]|uniref:Uncharacterized protein n=1 Tax=Methylobacterium mesophilicum SR1.6/6 TaxID=908290 RepID=A0A6B9FYA6_9HYPH|nr:hypothetical protein MMSR116_22640 [Methylobacterium mesophilicum SR1.6/6]
MSPSSETRAGPATGQPFWAGGFPGSGLAEPGLSAPGLPAPGLPAPGLPDPFGAATSPGRTSRASRSSTAFTRPGSSAV